MTVICILTSNSTTYDSVFGLLAMAGAEFDRLGHEVKLINLEAPDYGERINALLARRSETVAIGMSGIGIALQAADQRLFWEAAQIPFFCWYCDHPSYAVTRHKIQSRYVVHGYVFPDHAAFNRDFLHPEHTVFGVHLGIPDPGFFGAAALDKRNGRIVFAKSGWNAAALEQQYRETMPDVLVTILFASIEAARGQSCGAFPGILTTIAADHLVYLTPGDTVFNALLTRLDNYTRARRTEEVGTVLADYPVDFVGGGWERLAAKTTGAPARFLGAQSFDVVRSSLGTYLSAVSLNPNTDMSVHDRVFFALGAGTVPLFEANRFSMAHLPRLAPYSFGLEADSLRAAVEALLADPAAAQAATSATLADIYPRFSMRRSVHDIHEILTRMSGSSAERLLPAEPSPTGVWTPPRPTRAVA